MIDFKGRHFPKDIILRCVRWDVAYSLSYRDIEEMLAERGISADHTTIILLNKIIGVSKESPNP